MTALLPTADALFAAMGINEPLPRVDYVTTRPIDFDMSGFTAQERQWIDEAQKELDALASKEQGK